ncbi:amylo-alpha-1,6-glucosidase [Streptomyces sp. NPDC052236]|uniref:amylo-alpha-1,6-glucosidase n=1 Tax=Streptomyces sp. NPDC052236 TaxID=3365686 RepID=UPI0037D3AAF1
MSELYEGERVTGSQPPDDGSEFARTDAIFRATEEAVRVVIGNGGGDGLRAAGSAYPQVWARDAVITGLGLLSHQTDQGTGLLKGSLDSLAACQSQLGRIPNHVFTANPETGLQADTVFAGAVDASLWYIVGHDVLSLKLPDSRYLADRWDSIANAYRWLEYQDVNECGLLEVHESMDWADLYANRYNSLLPNVLWFAANRSMARMANRLGRAADSYRERAEDIRFKINQLLWVGPEIERQYDWIKKHRSEWETPARLVDTLLVERPYYLPYMAFRAYGDRFDTLGNLLAVIFGVADARQSDRIMGYIEEAGVNHPWPVKAFWPPVMPGDEDWREYYRQYNLNIPHQYHNGGAWPFIGGFYVAALVRAGRSREAHRQLERLAEMNRMARHEGEWEFNEWFHGLSGKPMGNSSQSWSAGMFLYAGASVEEGRCPFFGEEEKW